MENKKDPDEDQDIENDGENIEKESKNQMIKRHKHEEKELKKNIQIMMRSISKNEKKIKERNSRTCK